MVLIGVELFFPTPVKQIDKLEAQNKNLAINVFGWENDCVIVHRISKKEKSVPRINLRLIESGEKQHHCYVKTGDRFALRSEQSSQHKTLLHVVLNRFFKRGLVGKIIKKYCNGLKGKPTRIDMPKEEEKILSFQNYYKQMKAPYVIYADFEALVKKNFSL